MGTTQIIWLPANAAVCDVLPSVGLHAHYSWLMNDSYATKYERESNEQTKTETDFALQHDWWRKRTLNFLSRKFQRKFFLIQLIDIFRDSILLRRKVFLNFLIEARDMLRHSRVMSEMFLPRVTWFRRQNRASVLRCSTGWPCPIWQPDVKKTPNTTIFQISNSHSLTLYLCAILCLSLSKPSRVSP